MALGIRGGNPIWAEFDLQGNLFDDTFYLFVLENTIPYAPALIYSDPDLNVPLTNPIQFLGNGTLPIDVYFESDVVYRLEFRQGDTQQAPLIYEVDNYVAGTGGSTPVDTVAFASSNQITNPQFAIINFNSPYTITGTNPDPIELAPGWVLELAGTGSVTITQVPLNNANTNPSNAPYALRLTMSGWTADSVILRQRFEQNGMLWADKIVSSTITARLEGSPQSIIANLFDSDNNLLGTVLSLTSVNEGWNQFTGNAPLPAAENTDEPPAAYIEYRLSIPSDIDIYITSIQLVVQELPIEPTFEQDSIERQIDHLFHYYRDALLFKPIPSYLVGWDFPLNPALANGKTVNATADAFSYTYDQTILFQSMVSRINTTMAANGAMVLTTTAGPAQAAIIQYLPQAAARSLLEHGLSVMVEADSTVDAGLTGTVSLWVTTNVAAPILPLGFFTGLNSTGKPNAGIVSDWTEIPRNGNLGDAKFTLVSTLERYGFSGWNAPNGTLPDTTTFFAIVIGTANIPITKGLSINSVSLVPGDIPTIPAPQTLDEVLRECQYYYRKSFEVATVPIQSAGQNTGEYTSFQGSSSSVANAIGPIVTFDNDMRATPVVTLYNPVAGNAQMRNYSQGSDWSLSVATRNLTPKGFIATGTTPIAPATIFNITAVHWTADARLGVV